MMILYDRIMEESPHVFKDGSIGSREQFLQDIKYNPDNLVYICTLDGQDVVGIVWFNRFQYNHAQGHFCFFKDYWGSQIILEAGRKSIEAFFRHTPCATVIGLTPASNFKALNFIHRLGALPAGMLKQGYHNATTGSDEDAVISQFMREDYEGLH